MPLLTTAARDALGPKSRHLQKRLAFLNALYDSRNSCTILLNLTYGNFLAHHTARTMTGSVTVAHNSYVTKVQATTENTHVFKRLVRRKIFAQYNSWCPAACFYLPDSTRHDLLGDDGAQWLFNRNPGSNSQTRCRFVNFACWTEVRDI